MLHGNSTWGGVNSALRLVKISAFQRLPVLGDHLPKSQCAIPGCISLMIADDRTKPSLPAGRYEAIDSKLTITF